MRESGGPDVISLIHASPATDTITNMFRAALASLESGGRGWRVNIKGSH